MPEAIGTLFENAFSPRLKLIFAAIFFSSFLCQVMAQNISKFEAIHIELAGSGGLASLNYEKSVRVNNSNLLVARIGLTGFPIDSNNGIAVVIPTIIQAHFERKKHNLVLGFGQGLTITTKGNLYSRLTPVVAYRYLISDRYFLGTAYTPLISYILDFQYQHWAGLQFGYIIK